MPLLEEEIKSYGSSKTFLIDGFPRTLELYNAWNQHFGAWVELDLVKVIFLDAQMEKMLQRILRRAQEAVLCHATEGCIVEDERADDNEMVFRKRYEGFQ